MPDPYRSRTITVGDLPLGGTFPVRIQSMTNTDTNDIRATVEQCRRMVAAGAELVRLTTQGIKEVQSLEKVRTELRALGCRTPLVADIHFKPALAPEAARVVEKIRINPGNYLKDKSPDHLLTQLINTCRKHGTAIRIGVNHGSLSDSILTEFGDTPAGMAESALRFLRICQKQSFEKVVVSLKSSNPRIMVQSVRLLVHRMMGEGMDYPLHLGVTEAGEGAEGVILSAVGIAPLLMEGMGDTVRVSLTGPPEDEMPVAADIVRLFPKPDHIPCDPFSGHPWDPFCFERRRSVPVAGIGGMKKTRIISPVPPEKESDLTPDRIASLVVSYELWQKEPARLSDGRKILMLERGSRTIPEVKLLLSAFCKQDRRTPILYRTGSAERDPGIFTIKLAGELGALLVDGAIDAVWADNPFMDPSTLNETVLAILQAAGARISRTSYIACPSCGRTRFDIVTRLKEVKAATSHLASLKIAVMGCIVNGPGEMADADYGYVGAGPGRITLYKGKIPVRKRIPETEALDALIRLMKEQGDWKEP
ncbi:MAG TPA: 4-hydroxy-3-methylbut-2-en-1-yl diphosphate synthase [Bacteroides sp.]|nr:4-hydroxy-3-methylbut-2-en-1-yl diphosphate synthase [Bacteroides sp.]